jgi:hypothetical protein
MKLFINEELVVDTTVVQVREVVAHNASVLGWFNSAVKTWNTFYKRVELRDTNGTVWGLEL